MPHDWTEFEPPDRLNPASDGPLMGFLQAHRAVPVRISLRHQRRADSRVLQVLLTAAKAWRAGGLGFDVTGLPPQVARDCARLGLTGANTGWSGLP